MNALPTRIRRARTAAKLSQAELARRVGVKRSAVTQWEHPAGTVPSMPHLLRIAIETGTGTEWLATGRGPMRDDEAAANAASADCVRDETEREALERFRRLPAQKRRIALQILDVLAG